MATAPPNVTSEIKISSNCQLVDDDGTGGQRADDNGKDGDGRTVGPEKEVRPKRRFGSKGVKFEA